MQELCLVLGTQHDTLAEVWQQEVNTQAGRPNEQGECTKRCSALVLYTLRYHFRILKFCKNKNLTSRHMLQNVLLH